MISLVETPKLSKNFDIQNKQMKVTRNLGDQLKEHLNYNSLKKQDNITMQGSLDSESGDIFVKIEKKDKK